jgi:hypothetical protein
MVLDHFTEKSFYRIFLTKRHLTETPFDRTSFDRPPFDRMPFDRNTIWPNRRKFILLKGHITGFFSENGHLTESTFDKKCHLTEKKLRRRSFDRKCI